MELLLVGAALLVLVSARKPSTAAPAPPVEKKASPSPPAGLSSKFGDVVTTAAGLGGGLATVFGTGAVSKGAAGAAAASAAAPVAAGAATALGPGTAGVLGAGTVAGGVVGSAAIVAATGAAGYAITGQPSGAVGSVYMLSQQLSLGSAGIVTAQAGAVGTVLGRELDKLFSVEQIGKTDNVRRTLFEVVGYVSGVVIGLNGLLAVPVVGQFAALILGIVALVDDFSRKAYGQTGALRDAIAEALRFYEATLISLRNAAEEERKAKSAASFDDERLKTAASRMTAAWAETMWLARDGLMKTSPGPIFIVGAARVAWAEERGITLSLDSFTELKQAIRGWEGKTQDLTADASQAGKLVALSALYQKVRKEPKGLTLNFRQHLQYWWDRGALPGSQEVYADEFGDSIRVDGLWLLGNDTERDGQIRVYPA